ncbi:hypothetical protein HELRODRAFT_162598 [Helobdella robusta]|uniref:Uncharacterized protein n=1 Tax=Helobdella robusta TaxID=6412 RepID=T1ESW6_HELRO|nr:hypothetical protein HELRODRAFT_162598 [Helobdella robusta]ESN99107.1 hypothetical protein HELRODRAFT_162598 [Helobdella robusta]
MVPSKCDSKHKKHLHSRVYDHFRIKIKKDLNITNFEQALHSNANFDHNVKISNYAEHKNYDKNVFSDDDCPNNCNLEVVDRINKKQIFKSKTDEEEVNLIIFKLQFQNYSANVMETYPYMLNSYMGNQWMWASNKIGRKLLELPLDSEVLSLYLMNFNKPIMNLIVSTTPANCLVMVSPNCRLKLVQNSIAKEIISEENSFSKSEHFLCHYIFANEEDENISYLSHRCCSVDKILSMELECRIIKPTNEGIYVIKLVIRVLSIFITLFSPIFVLKVKSLLRYDKGTKFFRASLKQGITGQRNYVIRISYRQLINLNDHKPFSLPRSLFRLLFYCYGEGKCCIHWWGSWPHQPSFCRPHSKVRKFWFIVVKLIGLLLIYPFLMHIAILLYFPKLNFYKMAINHSREYNIINPLELNLNFLGSYILITNNFTLNLWMIFSVMAFGYTFVVLTWTQNSLEKCLIKSSSKKQLDHTKQLQQRLSGRYQPILNKLEYGDDAQHVKHFVRIPCFPSKIRRLMKAFCRMVIARIPLMNVCFALYPSESMLFPTSNVINRSNTFDDIQKDCNFSGIIKIFCKYVLSFLSWVGFCLILIGYSTVIFLIADFAINVIFFVIISCFVYPQTLFPFIYYILVIFTYANGYLKNINSRHRLILKLIDENSPRLSNLDKSDMDENESTSVKLVTSHNLGAVKFIDSDGTEYVSKELYYGVCDDLECSWTNCLNEFLTRLFQIFVYMSLLLLLYRAFYYFTNCSSMNGVYLLVLGSMIPKLLKEKLNSRDYSKKKRQKEHWTKIISDILDKHVKVDRLSSAVDENEEHLSTYDVRPVGYIELDLPRHQVFRTLQIWKFLWSVSCEQQTRSTDSFVIALSNRLAAVSFLTRVALKHMPDNLDSEYSLKCWTLLVERCVLEAANKSVAMSPAPYTDTHALFPTLLQPLLSFFEVGNTIDSLVDSVNRELYEFCIVGVIVNYNCTSSVIFKLDENRIMAFNGSYHEDISDYFGSLIIVADFNAQNLQLIIKYLIDSHRPDSVSVYATISAEGYLLKSPEILDIESMV